jgi:nucleoside-diphosphate-sugar epimerase
LEKVDAVVHLAARAHVLEETAADPLAEHRRVNTEGTRRLAEQAAVAGVKRFVFISSIGVNGNNSLLAKNGRAFTEEDEPRPHDDYSQSKWEAEQALANISGIEKVIIRPPLIYGPGVPGNFRRLLGLARKGRLLPLGAVHNKRSLIGLENLCALISIALRHENAAGRTYLVADGEDVSTAELYTRICRLMDIKPRLISVPSTLLKGLLAAVGKRRMASRLCDTLLVDAKKARDELGWKPVQSLDEGLASAVKAFEEL